MLSELEKVCIQTRRRRGPHTREARHHPLTAKHFKDYEMQDNYAPHIVTSFAKTRFVRSRLKRVTSSCLADK